VQLKKHLTLKTMPRPRKNRQIKFDPKVTFYKPQGIPLKQLNVMELNHEELESLRLKCVEGLNQTDSAAKMNTSQSTFQRILSDAQKKLGAAVVNGMAIKIIK